jgi:dihydropyrimidinase
MTNFDLVLRGGAAILPGLGRAACDIAICHGRIAAIVGPGEQLAAATEISVRGLTVFPGVLDVHLHLGHGKDIAQPRVPLDADRETAAAAKGGVTCFIPYLMATEPFENIFDEVVSITQSGQLSLHHLDRTPACRCPSLCPRLRRADLQDIHE